MKFEFLYSPKSLTTQDDLRISVADLRDVIQAFLIPDEAQRLHELQTILDCITRKNGLPPGALGVM